VPVLNTDRALCEAPHDTPRTSATGLRVCTGHAHAAGDALASLPTIHANLALYLNATGNGTGAGPIVTTSRDPGLRIDNAVAAARADIQQCLIGWADYAITPRPEHVTGNVHQLRAPFTHGPARRNLTTIAHWIARRITWYLTDTRAADFATDLADTARRARSQRQHNHAATFAIGPCPEPDCTGTLITRLRPADSLLPSVIWCDASPTDEETGQQLHTWPADKWLTLGRKIHG
jgi:hypothetical protein